MSELINLREYTKHIVMGRHSTVSNLSLSEEQRIYMDELRKDLDKIVPDWDTIKIAIKLKGDPDE